MILFLGDLGDSRRIFKFLGVLGVSRRRGNPVYITQSGVSNQLCEKQACSCYLHHRVELGDKNGKC